MAVRSLAFDVDLPLVCPGWERHNFVMHRCRRFVKLMIVVIGTGKLKLYLHCTCGHYGEYMAESAVTDSAGNFLDLKDWFMFGLTANDIMNYCREGRVESLQGRLINFVSGETVEEL